MSRLTVFVLLVLAVAAGVYSASSTAVMPKVIFFSATVALYLSMLGSKRRA